MVAGPKVAQNAVKSLPVGFGGMPMAPMGGYATDGVKASPDSFYDWRLDEVARLRRLISGEMSEEEREEKRQQALYALEPIVTQNVMALHSVSAHRKVAMFNQRMTVVREDIERFYNKRRLRDLLKDMGDSL